MGQKHLVLIVPLEPVENKEMVNCRITVLAGPLKGSPRENLQAVCKTNIFRYYYYGATIEVADINNQGQLTSDPRDAKIEDFKQFGVGLSYALSFNSITQEILSINGFVYRFNHSTFCRNNPGVVNWMYQAMLASRCFVLRLYTINGAIVYAELHDNVSEDSPEYKYAISPGFIVKDKNILKYLVPQTQKEYTDSKEVLKQDEIDKIFQKYNS